MWDRKIVLLTEYLKRIWPLNRSVICALARNLKSNKDKYDENGYYWNRDEIIVMPLRHIKLSWETFCDDYINNHQEYAFYYKDRIIDLSNDGFNFCYSYNHQTLPPEKGMYNSPEELLKKAKFDGKTLFEIWTILK